MKVAVGPNPTLPVRCVYNRQNNVAFLSGNKPSMGRTVLIRGARQLLTLRGPNAPRRGEAMRQLGVIEDGAILISDGIITNVGPSRRLENLAEARSAEEINAAGRVVMPGFIDCHTHLVGAPPRLSESRNIDYGTTELTFNKNSVRWQPIIFGVRPLHP